VSGSSSAVPADRKARYDECNKKFQDLCNGTPDDHLEFFLRSFIFDLGDDWKAPVVMQKSFLKVAQESEPGKTDLNPVAAADFLQKNGRERTSLQRKAEVTDVDLDHNGRIAFIEYLLLHYKCMILAAYYKRLGTQCPHDLTRGGVGVVGVGFELLDELFTLPAGLPPELERAITEFMQRKRARESKLKGLEETAKNAGVRGLAATNELKQMETQDLTEMNRLELTLNAAKKRASTSSGDVALAAAKKVQDDAEKQKRAEAKARLAAKKAQFEVKS